MFLLLLSPSYWNLWCLYACLPLLHKCVSKMRTTLVRACIEFRFFLRCWLWSALRANSTILCERPASWSNKKNASSFWREKRLHFPPEMVEILCKLYLRYLCVRECNLVRTTHIYTHISSAKRDCAPKNVWHLCRVI